MDNRDLTNTSYTSYKSYMTLKQFITGFNFDNPVWHKVPEEFPHIDPSELDSSDKALFELIKVEWIRAGRPSAKGNKTNKSYTSNTSYMSYASKPHGGYRKLEAFKMAEIVYDFTVNFYKTYKSYMTYRTWVQMEQAARSGKQNIAEGSQRAAMSPHTERQLIDVARASQQELLEDYHDFLRIKKLPLWEKDDSRAVAIRRLAYKTNKTYTTYKFYMTNPESAANCAICLINQTNYLLDRLLSSLTRV